MKKVVTIVGARPQFVKLAALSKRLREGADEVIIHTGQHYDVNMAADFFKDLSIPKPDHNLGVKSASGGFQVGRMLLKLETILSRLKPCLAIVFGDTNSTLAGALAAAKMSIPVAHVEAGLRSFNRAMPEELNRILTDHSSACLFAPTATAMENLKREGLAERSYLTGDIMADVLVENLERIRASGVLEKLGLSPNGYYLLTLHRPSNVDEPAVLSRILKSLSKLDEKTIFPVHPRTAKSLKAMDLDLTPNIIAVPPQSYLNFVGLEMNAKKVITDSGGVQKEAYLLGIPCITLRPETEWVETVESGWNLLVSPLAPDLAGRISSFAPGRSRPPVFGKAAADNISKRIIHFCSRGRP